jgi:CRP-like cAMP-binding protein
MSKLAFGLGFKGSKMVSAEWLKKTELFGNLDESQLNLVLSHSSVEPFPEGKTIFRQGEEATRLYVLIEGTIDLTVKAQEKIDFMTSKVEGTGAVFGTPCLMEPFRYNVTATCLKSAKVLVIEAAHLKKMMEEDPKMGMEIMRRLASIYFNRLNDLRSGVSNLFKIFRTKAS